MRVKGRAFGHVRELVQACGEKIMRSAENRIRSFEHELTCARRCLGVCVYPMAVGVCLFIRVCLSVCICVSVWVGSSVTDP